MPLALAGCAGTARPGRTAHVAQPGYICDEDPASGKGAWARATLDRSGRQVAANWDWKGESGERLLRFSASASIKGAAPLNGKDAYATVQWGVPFPGRRRPPRLRLELRSDPESRYSFGAGFVSEYERTGDYLLMTSWPDLTAFARGAPRLTVILRDERARIVKRADIDPGILARGQAEIAATLDRLAAMVADFRQRCTPTDDIDPEIVVT